MSKPDLTRWNRAGLRRLRYVNANAATLLQILVTKLATHPDFGPWAEGELAPWIPLDGSTEQQDWQRAGEAYAALQNQTGTPALEIARSFARASHMLAEAIDAHVNEAFVGTATQWENLRRLLQMLDAVPRSPASASTSLVLQVKPGQVTTLSRGFPVKHTPDAGTPVVFETLEDVKLMPALNALRHVGFGRCPTPLPSGRTLRLDRVVDKLRVGDPVILEHVGRAAVADAGSVNTLRVFIIDGVSVKDGCTELELNAPLGKAAMAGWAKGDVIVHLAPADRLQVLGPSQGGQPLEYTNSALVLREEPRGLLAGQVIFIGNGLRGAFARVLKVDGRRLTLDRSVAASLPNIALGELWVSLADPVAVSCQIPDDGERAHMPLALRVIGDWRRLADARVAHGTRRSGCFVLDEFEVTLARFYPVVPGQAATRAGQTDLLLKPCEGSSVPDNPQTLFVPPVSRQWRVDGFLRNDLQSQKPFSHALQVMRARQLGQGDLCAVVMGRRVTAARVLSVSGSLVGADGAASEQSDVHVGGWTPCAGQPFYLAQTQLLGHFKTQAHVAGWDRNDEPISGWLLRVPPLDAALNAGAVLGAGRRLVIEAVGDDGDTLQAMPVTLQSANAAGDELKLLLDTDLPLAMGYTVANTVIRANVVLAGHGQSQAESVLGSGNAALSGQSFLFEQTDVAWVADATQAGGVRADIRVIVGNETWVQVSSLNVSGPVDPHYTVRLTEEGWLRLQFGDGVRGRRLPSGDNNLRVAWRRGCGSAGNLPASSLIQAEHPHPRLESIAQPLPSGGGCDVEDVAAMRRRGPATVRTMDRAVSLVDFENLAMSHSSVWQVRALNEQRYAQQGAVSLVIVPAGGGELAPLCEPLRRFLAEHALPGVAIKLLPFKSQILDLKVVLGVDLKRFDGQAIKARVREALVAALTLRERRIGAVLYLSEVVRIVENVEGVVYSTSHFILGKEKVISLDQHLPPDSPAAVIHLDPTRSLVDLSVEQSDV